MQKPTTIITGASGYLGGCVTRKFTQEGWETVSMTRRIVPQMRTIAFRLGELVEPAALAGVNALVHCAYDMKAVRRKDIWATNVRGTERLFCAAREAGIGKLVFISTISAFEGCKSLYGQAKLDMEAIAREHGALILRPGLIYSNTPGGMFGRLKQQVAHSKIIPLIGDGSQLQYLVQEADLCEFLFRYCAGKFPLPPTPVIAAHERGITFRQILEAIAKSQGANPCFINLPWRLMWAGFRFGEILRLPLPFRSDSIVSLMNQNPHPDFSQNLQFGLHCRAFHAGNL